MWILRILWRGGNVGFRQKLPEFPFTARRGSAGSTRTAESANRTGDPAVFATALIDVPRRLPDHLSAADRESAQNCAAPSEERRAVPGFSTAWSGVSPGPR